MLLGAPRALTACLPLCLKGVWGVASAQLTWLGGIENQAFALFWYSLLGLAAGFLLIETRSAKNTLFGVVLAFFGAWGLPSSLPLLYGGAAAPVHSFGMLLLSFTALAFVVQKKQPPLIGLGPALVLVFLGSSWVATASPSKTL